MVNQATQMTITFDTVAQIQLKSTFLTSSFQNLLNRVEFAWFFRGASFAIVLVMRSL